MTATELGATVLTLAIAGAGAALFWLIGFPAAVLTGPATAVTLASLAGVPVRIPPRLRDACFLVLGISIGGTVTPEVIATAMSWPVSLVVLTATLVAALWVSRILLQRGFSYDGMTALLAATPGHLSYVLGLSTDLKADVARVALVQSVRVLMLTLLVPVLLRLWGVEGEARLSGQGPQALWAMAVLFPLSVVLGLLFKRWSIPAPYLLGAMTVSAIGHGTDLTPGVLPVWLTVGAFITMGALIGTRFLGVSARDIRAALWAGVAVTLIACAVAAAGALVAAELTGLPAAVLLLAFAPGGVEVMAALAVETGLEPAFVAAHHVLRLLVLTILIPVLLSAERRRSRGTGRGP